MNFYYITNEELTIFLIFIVTFFVAFRGLLHLLKNKSAAIIAGLTIALIAIYYLDYSQIIFTNRTQGIEIIILLTIVPLIIALYFVYSIGINGLLRKMFLILYGIMNIALIQKNVSSTEYSTNLTILISILIVLAVLFDKKIKEKLDIKKNLKGV